MRPRLALIFPCAVSLCLSMHGQITVKKFSEPSGKTLDKALKESLLVQPGAKPFHIKLLIGQSKTSDSAFSASIEETWLSPTQWARTVRSASVSEMIVVNSTGTHFVVQGDYFPVWLHNFITALFAPVSDVEGWDKLGAPLTHIEMSNGGHSSPCMHSEFFFGIAPVQQINFATVCFKDGLLESSQAPGYFMAFKDYVGFGKLKVPLTLSNGAAPSLEIVGKVVTLESSKADASAFATPAGARDNDPFSVSTLDTAQLAALAGGSISLPWPTTTPGSGMFTSWVSLDSSGTIREAQSLNSDESGFAALMSSKLVGQHWKPWLVNGQPVQAQGAVVFAYPPPKAN